MSLGILVRDKFVWRDNHYPERIYKWKWRKRRRPVHRFAAYLNLAEPVQYIVVYYRHCATNLLQGCDDRSSSI